MAAGIEPAGGSGTGSLGKGCVGVVDAGVHRGGRDGDGNAACRCSRWGEGLVAAVAGAALQDQIAACDQVAVAAGSLHGIGHPAGALAAGTGCAHPKTDRCGHGDRHRQQAGEALLRCLDRDVGVGTGGAQLGVAYPGGQGRAGYRKVGGRGHTEAVFSPGGPHAHGHGTAPHGHRAGHGHHLGVHRLIVAGVDHDFARGLQGHIGHFGDQITGEGVDRIGTATGQGHPGADAGAHPNGHRCGAAGGGDVGGFAIDEGFERLQAHGVRGGAGRNVAQVSLHIFLERVAAETDADADPHTHGHQATTHTHRHRGTERIGVDQRLLGGRNGDRTSLETLGRDAATTIAIDAGSLADEHGIGGFAAGGSQTQPHAHFAATHANGGRHGQHHRTDAGFIAGQHIERPIKGDGAVVHRGLNAVGVVTLARPDDVAGQRHTDSGRATHPHQAGTHAHRCGDSADTGGDAVVIGGGQRQGARARHGHPVDGGDGGTEDRVGGFGTATGCRQTNPRLPHAHAHRHRSGRGGCLDGRCCGGGDGDGPCALQGAEIAHGCLQLPLKAVVGQRRANGHGEAHVGLAADRYPDTQGGTDGDGLDLAGVAGRHGEVAAAQGSPRGNGRNGDGQHLAAGAEFEVAAAVDGGFGAGNDAIGDLGAGAAETHPRAAAANLGGNGRCHRHGARRDGGHLAGRHRNGSTHRHLRIEDSGPQGGRVVAGADGIAHDRHADGHPNRRALPAGGHRHGRGQGTGTGPDGRRVGGAHIERGGSQRRLPIGPQGSGDGGAHHIGVGVTGDHVAAASPTAGQGHAHVLGPGHRY